MKKYLQNTSKILKTINNPLKRLENINKKDELEKDFYDNIAKDHLKNFDENLYSFDENEKFPLTHQYFYSLLEDIENKKILDCCCGYGFTSVKCAKRNAYVTGIDISPKMVKLAKKNAVLNDVSNNTNFEVMSVENIKYNDNTFDLAVGIGAMHHLNLNLAGKEISRVLKSGGKAFFIEPRIPFKSLIIIRSFFPNNCYESPAGAQLSDKDILYFSKYFSDFKVSYFNFLKKLSRFQFLKNYENKLDEFDLLILKKYPQFKRFYWAFVLEFTK